MRAVAIVAVLLYHAQVSWAGGGYVGVDMFFVISGFLITGLILGEIEKTSTLSLRAFYGRRMKRLLPAIVVVLAAVVALSWVVLSPIDQENAAWDVVAAGGYVVNWRLALQAADYFGAGLDASPVQHFWTLAVEEQFYIVWPALLLAATWWWRRRSDKRRDIRRVTGVVLILVAASSFVYNLHLTESDAGVAYFSTFTRAWEFTLGAALALIAAQTLRYPRALASVLAWGGLAAIAWSIVNLSDETPFPGMAALVPTLGTVAIILAGFNEKPVGLSNALGVRPMRHIGRLSYSWYLWHWPPLVFAAAAWGRLSGTTMLAISAASYIPALLTHKWVEWPLHHHPVLGKRPGKALALGVACTAVSVSLGLLLFAVVPQIETSSEEEAPGAATVNVDDGVTEQQSADKLRPAPLRAYEDRSAMHDDGCLVPFRAVESPPCEYGDKDSDTTVILFGDSTAMHYFPALEVIAEKNDWRLVGLTKAGCSAAEFTRFNAALKREYTECYEWRDHAFERIEKERPEMVVMAGRADAIAYVEGKKLKRVDSAPVLEQGWISAFKRVQQSGAKVVLMADGPRPDKDIPECVSENTDELSKCAFERAPALDYIRTDRRAARDVEGIRVIDVTPRICNERVCPAVIGNVIVYRQVNHFTATYMATLADYIEHKLPKISG